jgi:hypothetical protein
VAAIKIEDREIQFVADFHNPGFKQPIKAAILTPFVEMVARNLPGHNRLIVGILGNWSFWPLTAGVQHVEHEIKNLLEWLFAFKAAFCD